MDVQITIPALVMGLMVDGTARHLALKAVPDVGRVVSFDLYS